MSLFVKLFGIVNPEMAEARMRKGRVAHIIGQYTIGWFHIEGLRFKAATETTVVIVEASSIERNVASGVYLIVDVQEKITADAAVVVFLRCGLVPNRVVGSYGIAIYALQFPTVGGVDSLAIAA